MEHAHGIANIGMQYKRAPLTQANILSRFPPEIQVAVWSYLSTDPDRISLSLTCKTNAMIFEQLKSIQNVREVKRITFQHKLRVLLRLFDWMPKEWRLCFHCFRYCPRYRGDWGGSTKMEDEIRRFDRQRVHAKVVSIPNAMLVQGPRCPLCVERVTFEMVRSKPHYMELQIMLKKHKFV
jgi:hypothetical protein